MVYLTAIWKFIKDPKNTRLLVFIGALIFCVLYFRQCSKTNELERTIEKQKTESIRLLNNEEAKNAELRNYKLNDSTNRAIIQGYQLTQEELKNQYKSLTEGFEDLKKKTALALAKGTIHTKETIYINTTTKIDSIGVEHIVGVDTMKIDEDNYRKVTFDTPIITKYYNKKDSTEYDFKKSSLFSQTYPGKTKFTLEQSIGLKVGLFQDKKDKKIYIAAQSKYPNLTFTKLEGADIMADPDSKKVTKEFRKTWGVGVNMGYGMTVDFKNNKFVTGPYIGVGLHYSPKFLQWGK